MMYDSKIHRVPDLASGDTRIYLAYEYRGVKWWQAHKPCYCPEPPGGTATASAVLPLQPTPRLTQPMPRTLPAWVYQ